MSEKLRVGQSLTFETTRITPEGKHEIDSVSGEVTRWHKGGFYGQVAEVTDERHGSIIVKTAEPYGLIHRWGRLANWEGRLFPSQVNGPAAAVDSLSQKIAHELLPSTLNVYVPDSYGYGFLPNFGYVQVLETLQGQSPKYTQGFSEYQLLMTHRHLIANLGFELGSENLAGQSHPDNIFGLENLWVGIDGKVQLVDQLPAIRHTGRFLGIRFPFLRFHDEIRSRIGKGKITFNNIDTTLVRQALSTDSRFSRVDTQSVLGYLEQYDIHRGQLERDLAVTRTEWNIAGLIALGMIDKHPEIARNWFQLLINLATTEGEKLGQETLKSFTDSSPVRFITEPEFRRLFLTGLAFAEEGYKKGNISPPEWHEIKSLVWGQSDQLSADQKRRIRNYVTLWGIYIVTSRLWDIAAVFTAISSEIIRPQNHLLAAALGITVAQIIPPISRRLLAYPFFWLTRQNIDVVKTAALVPLGGWLLAVPAQMAVNPELANQIAGVWHLTVRGIIAKFSSLLPWGGWGTDTEARWLQALAKKQQFLHKHFQIPPFIVDE